MEFKATPYNVAFEKTGHSLGQFRVGPLEVVGPHHGSHGARAVELQVALVISAMLVEIFVSSRYVPRGTSPPRVGGSRDG